MDLAEQQVHWILRYSFASDVAVGFSVLAIQIFMWIYMMSFYFEASVETRKRRLPYLAISFIVMTLYGAEVILWSIQVFHVLLEVVPGRENVLAAFDIMETYDTKYGAKGSLLGDIAFRLSDSVLLYRCYIIWSGYPWVMILPVCIYFANLGINIRTYVPLDFQDNKLNAADVFLFVALNVLLTSLILFRLLRARHQLKSALPDADHNLYPTTVGILLESASLAAIPGIGFAISQIYLYKSLQAYKVYGVFRALFVNGTVLAPQLIIFRVATGASWVNMRDTSAMLSRSIEFAPAKIKSDEDLESRIEGGDH